MSFVMLLYNRVVTVVGRNTLASIVIHIRGVTCGDVWVGDAAADHDAIGERPYNAHTSLCSTVDGLNCPESTNDTQELIPNLN